MEDVIERIIIDPYGFIYITTNLINGKRYLGQRVFTKGWQNYLGSGTAFKRALKKYGEENFHKDIIYICYSQEELNQAEYELSVFLDVVERDDYYNLVYGGGSSRGRHTSQETRDKIRQKAKDRLSDPRNNPMYGIHRYGDKNPMYGKIHSAETRQKISNQVLGIITKRSHFIYCIELNRCFRGSREAERETKIKHESIVVCCSGKTKSAGKHPETGEPLHWLYAEDAIKQGYITQQDLDDYLNNLREKEKGEL